MGNFTFGLLAILFAAFCSSPAFDPEVVLGSWAHDDNAEDTPVIEEPHFTRTSDFFTSEGERCHAWLYLPRGNSSTPPVVLMAQGLGAQKDFGLHMYAEVFAAAGIASYSFDYRTFGGSSGEPRNVINPWRHIKDYQAALEHVRTDGLGGRVDPERLALWGTSFSGGHVLAAAAEDAGNVTAVVSQMPHLDGRAASRRAMAQRGLLGTLRIVHAVLKDLGRSFMGLSPACLKIAGKTGELAMMTMSEEQLQKYFAKHPAEYLGGWVNLVPARAAAMIGLYSPKTYVPKVRAPILFVAASNDELCPAAAVHKAAADAADAEVAVVDGTHFSLYMGPALAETLGRMTAFLKEKLGVA